MARREKTKLITTITGKMASADDCRKFDKKWYLIGNTSIKDSGDCYLIAEKYYREETGIIVYNYTINEYVVKDNALLTAVVDIVNDKLVTGYITPERLDIQVYLDSGYRVPVYCVEKLLKNKNYREELSTGYFWDIKNIQAAKLIAIRVPRNEYKHSLPYDSKGKTNEIINHFEKTFNEPIGFYAKEFEKILQGLTFGVEFETVRGYIPKRITDKYGVLPLRDGSISGIEYVTAPMKGAKGIQGTVNFLKELEKRTEYDDSCSLHVHLGGMPRTKEFILAFSKLTMAIQDQLYKMFPLYKKYNFKIKNKNYSSPFPTYDFLSRMDKVINNNNINENFDILFNYLSGGNRFKDYGNDLNKVEFHPSDSNGTQKWNIRTR